MTISNVSRSFISGIYQDKKVYIEGEAYHRGYGSPDFVAYTSSLAVKSSDGVSLRLNDSERRSVLDAIAKAMKLRQQTIEFEP